MPQVARANLNAPALSALVEIRIGPQRTHLPS